MKSIRTKDRVLAKWQGVAIVVAVASAALFLTAAGGALGQNDPNVVIGKGHVGRSIWAASLERPHKPKAGPNSFCLGIALASPSELGSADISESYECDSVSAAFPVARSVSHGSGKKERSAYVVIFVPSAARTMLNFGRQGTKTVKLRHLTEAKVVASGVPPVAFWSRGFAGRTCLRRLVVWDKEGSLLSDSGRISHCEM